MKGKIFSTLVAVALALCVSLVMALPAGAVVVPNPPPAPQMEEVLPEGVSTGDTWNVLKGTVDFVYDFHDAEGDLYDIDLMIYGPAPYNSKETCVDVEFQAVANPTADWDATDWALATLLGVTSVTYSTEEEKWTITVNLDKTITAEEAVWDPLGRSEGDPVWPAGQYNFYSEVRDQVAKDNEDLYGPDDPTVIEHRWGYLNYPPAYALYVYSFHSIQTAIDFAGADDTVNVAAGEYAGAIVDESVTLNGAAGGASIITSGVPYKVGNPAHNSAFRPEADGAEIRNFTINCDVAVKFDLGIYAVGVDDVIIDSLTINSDGSVQAISNWGGSNWEITNNVITNTVAAGGGGIGIFLGARPANDYYETPLPVCSNNLVQYNEINATATATGYSCPGICVCLDLRYDGHEYVDGSEDVSGNQILDNNITSNGAPSSVGIEVGTILGDSGTDPVRTDETEIAAVMAAGAVHDNTVQDNTTDGTETGIYFFNVTDLTITLNEIENSVTDGIYAEYGQSGTVITGNTFTNNDVQLSDDTESLDIAAILATNTFDRAVTVDNPGASLLHVIWSKIQDAIDAAVADDTVNVAAGTYDEDVVIDKGLTLISDTGDYRTTGVILNGPIALNNVDSVTVQGFKFQDCSATGYKHVIYTGGTADNITIAANSFDNCEGLNIHIYYGGETWFENWTITDNKITDVTGTNASGIWVQRLRNSTISSNEISNTTYAGMILDRLESVTVSNNNISDTLQKGIQVATSPDCNVVIEDNYITNTNTSHDADEGAITIYPDVTNIRIENNTLTANYQGFTVRDKAGAVSDVHVNFNNIYGNDGLGMGNFAQGGGTIDAENNWWGSVNGPTHAGNTFNVGSQGDAVSDNVDYVPWYDTDMTGTSFAPVVNTDTVDGFSSIQAAIDAATGTTIACAVGTYTEGPPIVINKNISIVGEDKDTTIINPAADTGSSGDARGWFLVDSGKTFNLSNVTLDGSGHKVFQGIRHKGSGTIANCAFNNIQFEPSGSAYNGVAMAVMGDGNVDVTGCTFTGIGRIGVIYFGAGVTGSTFSDNTYVGKGIGDWLDYGVEVGGGACATISDNTISGNRGVASSDGSTSAGILVTTYYGAGTQATITGNTLTDNTEGIAVGYDGTDTSTVVAQFNNIAGNDTGVSTTAPPVDATNNWWGHASGPTHADNPSGTGNAVSDNVDYDPWLGAPVAASKSKTVVGSGTVDAKGVADTEVDVSGTGSPTVTVTKYSSNPGSGFGGDTGKYVDVHIDDITNVTEIVIRLYYTDAEIAWKVESSLTLRWWDSTASSWVACSGPLPGDTGVNTTNIPGPPAYSGFMWAKIRSEFDANPTIPTLEQLVGTPFGGGGIAAGGGGGGGGGAGAILPTVTGLVVVPPLELDADGIIQARCLLKTTDGKLTLDIAKGTKLLDSAGAPLRILSAARELLPPSAPPDAVIILAYNFRLNGATFSPAITLTLNYDPATLPEDIAEENLYIAYWDGSGWVALETTVDTLEDAASCQPRHFTIFALIGPIAQPAPAAFSASNLSIQPLEVQPNEAVTITLSVANTGGTEGSYNVVIKINGATEAERSITVAPSSSQNVSFSVTEEEAGSYNVTVEGLSGSFTVVTPAAEEAPPEAGPPISWPLIWIIIAAVVVVGLVIFFAVRRRAY